VRAGKSVPEVDVIVNYFEPMDRRDMQLGDIIRRNGNKYPERPAVVDTQDGRIVTFGELQERMLRVANAMLGLADPGDVVAILAENLPEYVECYYGVPAAGMALNFLNYRLHPKEWAWILNNAEARVLIVQDKYLDAMQPELANVPTIEHVIVIGGGGRGGYPDYFDVVAAAPPSSLPSRSTRTARPGCSGTSGTTFEGSDAHPPQPDLGGHRVRDRVRATARRAQLVALLLAMCRATACRSFTSGGAPS
jgi:acyl-CoA synthetase (AMP-forming)/AMP-acid ligase II